MVSAKSVASGGVPTYTTHNDHPSTPPGGNWGAESGFPQPKQALAPSRIKPFFTHDGGDPRKTTKILATLDPKKIQIVCGAGIAGHKLGLLAARHEQTKSHGETIVILTDRDHTHMNPITEKREAYSVDEHYFPEIMRKMSEDRVTTPMRFNGSEKANGFHLEPIESNAPALDSGWNILESAQINAASFRTHSLVSVFNQACAAEPNIIILTGKGDLDRPADSTKKPSFVIKSLAGDVLYKNRDYAWLWGADGGSSTIRNALAPNALDKTPHLGTANTMKIETPTEWSFDNFDGIPSAQEDQKGAHCFKISREECYTVITAHEADRSYAYLGVSLPNGDGEKIVQGSDRDQRYRQEKQRVTGLLVQNPFFQQHRFIKNSEHSDRYVRDVHRIAKIVFSVKDRIFLAGDAAASGPPILGLSMNELAKQLQLADRILSNRDKIIDSPPAEQRAMEQDIAKAHADIVDYRNGRIITSLHDIGFYTDDHLNNFEEIKTLLRHPDDA